MGKGKLVSTSFPFRAKRNLNTVAAALFRGAKQQIARQLSAAQGIRAMVYLFGTSSENNKTLCPSDWQFAAVV